MIETQTVQTDEKAQAIAILTGQKEAPATPTTEVDKAAVKQVSESEGTQDFSRQFAALSKKQQEMYKRDKDLKEREKKILEHESLEKLFDENPLEYLQKRGKNVDDFFKKIASHGEPPTAEDKVSALEKKLEQMLKAQEEKEKQSKSDNEKAQLDNFRKSVEHHIKGQGDKFALVNAQNAHELIVDRIIEHYEKEGELLTADQVAEEFENQLLENIKVLAKIPKLASLFTTSSSPEVTKTAEPGKIPGASTLNSSLTPTASSTKSLDQMTDEERWDLALKQLKGQA